MPGEIVSDEPMQSTAAESSETAAATFLGDSEKAEPSQDSSSESEANETDRNNNDRSPTTCRKFRLDSAQEAHTSHATEYINSAKVNRVRSSDSASSSSSHSGYDSDDELMEENIVTVDTATTRMATEVMLDDIITPLSTSGLEERLTVHYEKHRNSRQSHANANENNNSNRKRSSKISASSRDSDGRNRMHRGKRRSVQLSSVRASAGIYEASAIKPFRERMICKDGTSNVHMKKLGKFDLVSRYSRDIYTTLIDLSWSWVILLTALVYVGHWIIFGFIYWLFAVIHNDYEKIFPSEAAVATEFNSTISTQASSTAGAEVVNEDPCVSQVYDFASAFLFSMESETTIGYGYRTIGTSCPEAVTCLIIQCVISAIFDTWVIGMCFSRLARPDARAQTLLYAKNAVICTRDGKRCLVVRVANLRKSLLLTVSCRAHVITLRAAQVDEEEEGHQFVLEQKELNFQNANTTMLTAPVEYQHIIDEDSPLHSIPEKCFVADQQNWFEIVIIVTGVVEATGMTMHAQTSYLSSEIKYKHRYARVVSLSPKKDRYVVDFSKFHETLPEPQHVELMYASRQRKQTKEEQKTIMSERCAALVEENEDDVFSVDTPLNKHRSLCMHTFDDDNMNVVCSCGNLRGSCMNSSGEDSRIVASSCL